MLSRQAQVSLADLHAIESGQAEGSFRRLARLAEALRVDLEDLVPWDQDDAAQP